MNAFTYLFLVALILSFIIQWWLTSRHQHSVLSQRHQTPEPFQNKISLKAHQKAADYTLAKLQLERFHILLGPLIMIIWTFGGLLEWLNSYWLSMHLSMLNTGVGVFSSLFLISYVLELPLTVWRTFVIEQRFGFNNTSKRLFLGDQCREILLLVALMTPLLYSILWLVNNQNNWWFTVWLLWSGFTLLMLWAYPSFIAPLFNRFKALEDPVLKERIEKLMQRTGFTSKGILVMDGSRRSGHGNAYFTGLGRSKRIVFYDTLLQTLNHDEVEAVLAHELGHFHHGHIRTGIITMMALSLATLILLDWLSLQAWFYQGLGMAYENSVSSPHIALILFMICAPAFSFFFAPVMKRLTRHHEYQADAFAAKHSDGRQLGNALIKLYEENAATLTPDPWYSAFHDSHPSAVARIQALDKQQHNKLVEKTA